MRLKSTATITFETLAQLAREPQPWRQQLVESLGEGWRLRLPSPNPGQLRVIQWNRRNRTRRFADGARVVASAGRLVVIWRGASRVGRSCVRRRLGLGRSR